MGLTYNNLNVFRYIQDKQMVSLSEVANRFQKNTTTIRREIDLINLYSETPLIEIKKSICQTKLSYHDYAYFVQSLTREEYTSTVQERVDAFIVMAFFHPYVNAGKLYESWGLSLTTKKQDMAYLRLYLNQQQLSLESLHKKGLYISGDELRFRFLVIQILYPLFDLTGNQTIAPRITNTPFEKLNYEFLEVFRPHIKDAFLLMNEFLRNYQLDITNLSEKFLLLFICMMKEKAMDDDHVQMQSLPLTPLNLYVCEDEHENEIYNIVLNLLDFSLNLEFPFDQKLFETTTLFVKKIEECLTSPIYTHAELVEECYCYFYKQVMLQHFHLKLFDRLVKNANEHLPVLYQIVQKYSYLFEEQYFMSFSSDQCTTLTFFFQKAMIRNRIVNKDRFDDKKRVVIVTNSSYERIQYFISQVKEYVEVEFVMIINLSELYRLDNIHYDYIFALSERIFNILKKQNYKVLQLAYFLDNQDIETLLLYGFPRIKTKFLTKEFVEDIESMDKEQTIAYLKMNYGDYFI